MKKAVFTFTLSVLVVITSVSVRAQEEKKQDLRQYLFPSFSVSTVKASTGKASKLLLNYNTVTEKMVFEQKGEYFDLVTNGVVDTIYMNGKRFIPVEDFFVEVIAEGKVLFAVQHRSNLKEPGMPAGYGTTSQLAASHYVSNVKMKSGLYNINIPQEYEIEYSPVNWLRNNGEWISFYNENQFLKIFPDRSKELKQYIKTNRLKMNRPADLEKLAVFCGELL